MISLFSNVKEKDAVPKSNIAETEYFEGVKNGRWQDLVLDYRTGKIEKIKLPAITTSGVFKIRNAKNLIEHSGFICIDVDSKDQVCDFDIEEIKKDEFVRCVHDSCSGNGGYAIYVKIDGSRHLDAFLALEEYFFIKYSIIVDKSCKDVSRLRFVSFDPHLYLNEKSKVFKKYLPKKEIQKRAFKPIVVRSDFDQMVNDASPLNLFDSYDDYLRMLFGLADEFKEDGRVYAHSLAKSSSKYNSDSLDKDYDKILKRQESGISIASVYYKFKDAGISLVSEKTATIKAVAKLADNPEEVLARMNIKDTENVLDKLPKKKVEEKTEIDLVIDLIKLSNVKFNEISRNFEFNGEEMTDRLLAKFYTTCWQRIDEGLSKDKIFTLIQNKDHSESYNPIKEWFYKNSHIQPSGNFDELVKCFKIDHRIIDETGEVMIDGYLETYLKKWLLGLIGSAYGTYSLMILVMTGEQGIKKTEFFRNLLPPELKMYYAESNLDEGKDSEILMTKKWLIIDDEFGGKSKRDATKLKRLSSQQTFSVRMPYGKVSEDLQRLAVLGGTSNEVDIINDPTGNRRIIPVNLISFDFERYKKINKRDLFIELYHEWENNKEGWFLTIEEIKVLNKTTVKNTEIMSEQEIVNSMFKYDPYGSMTNTDIKLAIEKLYPSFRTTSKRMGQALKLCGFEQKFKKTDSQTKRVYNIIQNA